MEYGRPATPAEPSTPAISVHDRGWVPALPADVYRIVTAVSTYDSWWPRTRAVQDVTNGGVALRLPALGRLRVLAAGERPHVGVVLQLSGDVDGVLEWYLESFKEGTVVNVFLRLSAVPRRWNRRALGYRSAIRDALVSLRRLFEDRASGGGLPKAPSGDR